MYKQKNKEVLKVCALSGTNEIGRNCNFIEYGNDIIMIDAGFSFPGEELYGIDLLLPNTKYLVQKKKNIKGLILTHGHLDHIGAIPYIIEELGFPPIYAGEFATALVEEKLKEARLLGKVKINVVQSNRDIQIGVFKVRFIDISHSIPDSNSIFIQSPRGNVFVSGDYKIDEDTNLEPIKQLAGRADIALFESTYAYIAGKSISEKEITVNLEREIREHNGRVIIAAFASLVSRIDTLVNIAKRTGRKILVSGRSLLTIIRIASERGYIDIPERLIITEREISKFPDNQLMILSTGSQAERYAALNRISLGEHKSIRAKKGDLVIMSSSEIPGNIEKIGRMTDRLIRQGFELLKNNEADIHSSGHGLQEDMRIFYEALKPKYVMPVHGSLTFRYQNKKNYLRWGHDGEKILLTEDGLIWEYENNVWKKTHAVEASPILIDGLGIRDTGDIVLKDRKQLSEYGIFAIVLNINVKSKEMIGRPKFISRGFVYMKTAKKLLSEIETIVMDAHREWRKSNKKTDDLTGSIEKNVAKYIYKKTEREPIILISVI